MTWFGHDGPSLARRLGLPRVEAYAALASTMDEAHQLAAEGAPAGTMVVAESQTRGRGREGRRWLSRPGAGLWVTMIERPSDAEALAALSLRVGLALAPALEPWSDGAVALKWPNDLFVGEGKLAGVLVEARWRGDRPDWVAVGVGVNLVAPEEVPVPTAHLQAVEPVELLRATSAAIRGAAAAVGPLTPHERDAFAARDLAAGRPILAPVPGLARGIAASGALLVETAAGVSSHASGSLIFASIEEGC